MLTHLTCTRCEYHCTSGRDMVQHLHTKHGMTEDLASVCVELQYKIQKEIYQPDKEQQKFLDEFDAEMKRILGNG